MRTEFAAGRGSWKNASPPDPGVGLPEGRPISLIRRLRQVPPRRRALQAANALTTALLCRPLRLTHVVEHPKSGGTWVMRMVTSYIGSKPFLGDRLVGPNDVIHTHRLYRRRFRRPIVLLRDPRDVYVSQYYHENFFAGREKNLAIEQFFEHDPARPLHEDFTVYLEAKLSHRTDPYFTFGEFVQSWINRPGACFVRYEDVLADPEAELIRMIRFVGHPIDPRRIRAAVEANRFEATTKWRDGVSRRPGEADPTRFERKGIAGDWRNHFDRDSCQLIERFEGWSLRRLGYESDRRWMEPYLASLERA